MSTTIRHPHKIEATTYTALHHTSNWLAERERYVARILAAADCPTHEHVWVVLYQHSDDRIATPEEVARAIQARKDMAIHDAAWKDTGGKWHYDSVPSQSRESARHTIQRIVPATICRDADGEIIEVLRGTHDGESIRDKIRGVQDEIERHRNTTADSDARVATERSEYLESEQRQQTARRRNELLPRRAARRIHPD